MHPFAITAELSTITQQFFSRRTKMTKIEFIGYLETLMLRAGAQASIETDKYERGFWIDAKASIESAIEEAKEHPAFEGYKP